MVFENGIEILERGDYVVEIIGEDKGLIGIGIGGDEKIDIIEKDNVEVAKLCEKYFKEYGNF